MTFGAALEAARSGGLIQRAGWNGKGMWVAYTPESEIPVERAKPDSAAGHRAIEIAEMRAIPEAAGAAPTTIRICGHLDMRAADGSITIGWNASQIDMMADDWSVLR